MKRKGTMFVLLAAGLFLVASAARGGDFQLPQLEQYLTPDGRTAFNDPAPLVLVVDPNPPAGESWQPDVAEYSVAAPSATFKFKFLAAGQKDPWGQVCQAFPAQARTAFARAGVIWGSKLKSAVPIQIVACWANLGSPSILGYSGVLMYNRNYAGLPRANTWYASALANALTGKDLVTSSADDAITFNSGFNWYFGLDGRPPAGKFDLVSVALHEIAHGLNFSGSARYAGGIGAIGFSGSPVIYDRFMESATGKAVTSYANPSAALGALFTSNNLWFDAPYSKVANRGARVKMHAPGGWQSGSSYSHLDYVKFKSTPNNLMVYAIGSGTSRQVIGPVILGLLRDLGWKRP